jgi:plastocyanin
MPCAAAGSMVTGTQPLTKESHMKRSLFALIGLAAFLLAVTAVATAASPTAKVTIRHQVKNCHAWAFNGGAYVAAAKGTVARNGTITVVDNDVMPHKLFQKSGPKAVFVGNPALAHVGASVKVTFPKAGTYVFGTKVGEDYMKGVKTVGEDNVLTLKITVR